VAVPWSFVTRYRLTKTPSMPSARKLLLSIRPSSREGANALVAADRSMKLMNRLLVSSSRLSGCLKWPAVNIPATPSFFSPM